MVALTTHFRQRQSQRGLRRDVLNFILEFGEVTFARKATWLYVRKRALPQQMRNSSLASRAAKWLLMIQEGVLINLLSERQSYSPSPEFPVRRAYG